MADIHGSIVENGVTSRGKSRNDFIILEQHLWVSSEVVKVLQKGLDVLMQSQVYPMVLSEIGLIYKKMMFLMRLNAPRRRMQIARDVPSSVFEEVRLLMTTNSYRTQETSTRTTTTLTITSREKIEVMFNFWGRDEGLNRRDLLRKSDKKGNKMNVVVDERHPFTLRYNQTSKRLFVTADYEVFNKYGVAQ
ncbi:uncharacterized protein LOC135503452 [Lineus longissimus]|uniref:uncharacterized protein LOC135503452 n=1 Tax=Lineus longissimus TaxID=88925 RepID=UPI00315CE246